MNDRKIALCVAILTTSLLVLAACSSSSGAGDASQESVLTACEEAFKAASEVSDMEDTVEDLDPAVRACETVDEWVMASEKYPGALDGADPVLYLSNRCLSGSFSGVAICDEVN